MKKTVKRKVSILLALIMLFFPVGNISIAPVLGYTNTVYAESKSSYKEIKNYIKNQYDSMIYQGIVGEGELWTYYIKYNKNTDALVLELISFKDVSEDEAKLTLRLTPAPYMKGKTDVFIEYEKDEDLVITATTKVPLRKIKTSNAITYKIADNNGNDYSEKEDLQESFRDVFDKGMEYWEELLSHSKYHLKDLGIKKYKKRKKLVHHDGDYVCHGCGARFTCWKDAANHCDEDMYTCSKCGKTFYDANEASKHGYEVCDCDILSCSGGGYSGHSCSEDYNIRWGEIMQALSKVQLP